MSTTYREQTTINLTDVIAPAFYPVHHDIADGKHTYYVLHGGRGSCKSSFASVEIILGMMQDSEANAVVFRKYGVTLRESVFEQMQWAIDALGVSELWVGFTNPMRYVYKPTGQKIIFRGLDKAKKTKSIKVSHGYFKYLFFEELDEFAGAEEIRTVQQSVLRGGSKFVVFKCFNPPISNTNWANQYANEPREDTMIHKSDYRSVPEEWLGEQFIADAEHLKATKPEAYEHEYLGVPVGLGTEIFKYLEIREITDEEIMQQEHIYQGQDWGWNPDPKAFIRLSYNRKTEKIMLIDEDGGTLIRVSEMAQRIKDRKYTDAMTYCGVDEIEHIADFRDAGIPARAAECGPGSVRRTFEWLQCRTIIIDPRRTPRAYKEFTEYEHELDKNGEVIDAYPDAKNHWIDATRYATSHLSMRRGNSA